MKRLFLLGFLIITVAGCSTQFNDYAKERDKAKQKSDIKYDTESNTVRGTTHDVMIEASYLSSEQADVYFSIFKGGKYRNPFPSRAYLVFSLDIENNSKKRVTYNPGMSFVLLDEGELVLQKDYTSLYTDFEAVDPDGTEERMQAFRVSSFDTTVVLLPGEKRQGLLIFPRKADTKYKKVGLLIDRLYLDHDVYSIPLLFQPGTVEEIEKEEK